MAILTDLPQELLELVYSALGSIDDVHHLGRACRATNLVIQNHNTYIKIMRSVIYNAPQHRYDIRLCRILDLHSHIVQHFRAHGVPIQPTPMDARGLNFTSINTVENMLATSFTDNSHLSEQSSISDACIHDILARWQGLRVLQDIWLARQLTDADYLPVNFSAKPEIFLDAYTTVQERDDDCPGQVSTRLQQTTELYASFNSDQKHRFHASVTKLWLMNEIRWVLTNFTYPSDFRVPLQILDVCMVQLDKQVGTPLLDELDLYSMYTFLYQHLLPLHSHALADQCSSMLPLTFSSDLKKDRAHSTRFLQLCLMAGQTYLQPPDIIDVSIRNKLMRRRPFPRLHLPASTRAYIHPSPAYRFPRGCNLTMGDLGLFPLRGDLLQESIDHLQLIQRATFTQCSRRPARAISSTIPPLHTIRGHLIRTIIFPLNGHMGAIIINTSELYPLDDLIDAWSNQRVQEQFELYARRDRREINHVFNRNWKTHVRWQIWWWANSDDKARMKLERWRLI